MTTFKKVLSIFTKASVLSLGMSFSSFAGQGDTYKFKWLDGKKEVYVLQNKIHENKSKFFFNLGYGSAVGPLSKFNDTNQYHASLGFYISEEWAIEGFYSQFNNENNEAYKQINLQILTQTSGSRNVYPHVVRMNQMIGGSIVYSPFYGKINTFNKIFYVDFNFGAGAGVTKYEHNTALIKSNITSSSTDVYEESSTITALLKAQFKWHITKTFKANIEFVSYWSKLPDLEDKGNSVFEEKDRMINSKSVIFSLGVMF